MITVKGLSKSFGGNLVFENVNFSIEKGSTTVILGASGCGKSTLLRCINRLEKPDSGSIEIDGEDILAPGADLDKLRRKLGMVYQSFNLFSHLNVMENIILAPMKVCGMSKSEAIKQAEELLAVVGMENRRYHMPNQLSGGQKQRVAIARSLAMKPEVMLFDEPTSALDPTMVDEVEAVIRRLVDGGMTSIIVTHEMRFAKNIASDVIFMAEHGIYERGTAAEVIENPSKELTRRFMYRSRMFERRVTKDDIDVYGLCSEIRQFSVPFGMTARQSRGIEYLCDEFLLPLLRSDKNKGQEAVVQVIAGEKGTDNTVILQFPTLAADPLEPDMTDEMGRKIISAFTKSLTSRKNTDGVWEIHAAL